MQPCDLPASQATDRRRIFTPGAWRFGLAFVYGLIASADLTADPATVADSASPFQRTIEPFLFQYCYDCHGDGMSRGKLAFDSHDSEEALTSDHALWLSVLKNVRSNVMPPHDRPQPSEEERRALADWIKREAFGIDPANPDPGRVTLRRLNRIEYRNTIKDLTGINYNTLEEFPPDDTGYGFDTVGDVLTISPLLLEKYLHAAEAIVNKAVPASADAKPDRFFLDGKPPESEPERLAYARKILRHFADRAFRRPVDEPTLDRLCALASAISGEPGQNFEAGVRQAMVAVLASPRFLFRIEETESASANAGEPFAPVDDYALASRLSYFLWSSMPDHELFELAKQGELRNNLPQQLERLLKSPRADALIENFTGQWLQSRDVEGISINERAVLRREGIRRRQELDRSLRLAMQSETEMYFGHVIREDRKILELIQSDYTFLDEELAGFYGIPNVEGKEMRRVTLPPDSPRGGVLTMGSLLIVTSNPTRTSPVKRGLFILDNILGTPAPPAPPNIPELEEAEKEFKDRQPTIREAMEIHRSNALCHSCHSRMDPLGLALENFNALGLWRETEHDQPIDASGQLISGESFHDIRDLKKILAEERRLDFYRCLTEKLLTYALGRGLEYYDVQAVDDIVDRLEKAEGRSSALLLGIVESAPFRNRRNPVRLAETHATAQVHTPLNQGLP
jgi:mono/diheme cytochrome c family protein